MRILTLGLMITLAASAASLRAQVITLDMVPVGNAGNVADPATGSLYGAVPYNYNIGKYDVTVGQYVAFLNSVATKSDPYGLYNSGMAPGYDMPTIGIVQSGVPGSYSYTVGGSYSQAANCPIYDVSWGDAARFANWLDNGQPTSGTESTGTTEAGAYALNGATTGTQLMHVPSPSHSGVGAAAYFLPSENEWYKAAYYSGGGTNSAYYAYPTKSNTAPGNTLPDLGNNANFYLSHFTDPTNYLTPVGSFADSRGPYGTYDMGGDVFQWNEADVPGSCRGCRGGSWDDYSDSPASSYRYVNTPTIEGSPAIGFRVASSVAVPEPGSLTLLLVCAVAFGIWRQRRNA